MVLFSVTLTIAKWIKHLQSSSLSFFISYYTLDTADPNSIQNTHVKDRPSTYMTLLSTSLWVHNSVDEVAAQC